MFPDYSPIVLPIHSDKEKKKWIKSVAHLLFYEVWMVVTDCRLYKSFFFFRKELCKKLYKNVQI